MKGDTRSSIFAIDMLPAEHGDCLLIEYGDTDRPSRFLIDCGAQSAVPALVRRLGLTGAAHLELFVLTHIDADHIGGVPKLFAHEGLSLQCGDVWFNGWHQIDPFLGVKQGEEFSALLEARKLPWNRAFTRAPGKYPDPVVVADPSALPVVRLPGGMRLTLLSPGAAQLKRLAKRWQDALADLEPGKAMLGRKLPPAPVEDPGQLDLQALALSRDDGDASVPNGSSIAFLAEFDGRSAIFTGDAHADVLAKSIAALQVTRGRDGQRLQVDALKLSHHGSANATSAALLDSLDCRHYLVSSNGNMFYHPDRETIARVILRGGKRPTLHFNYRTRFNQMWDDAALKKRYGFACRYPGEGNQGLRVEL